MHTAGSVDCIETELEVGPHKAKVVCRACEQTISGPKKRSIELISTERKSAKQNVACTVMSSDEVA